MSNKSPIDFLQLFITDEMLHTIVEQTNLFAEQFIESQELKHRSRVLQWCRSLHDVEELKKVLAMIIVIKLVS